MKIRTSRRLGMVVILAILASGPDAFSDADESEVAEETPEERLVLRSGEVLPGRSLVTAEGWLDLAVSRRRDPAGPLDQIERLEVRPRIR